MASGPFVYADVMNYSMLERIVVDWRIGKSSHLFFAAAATSSLFTPVLCSFCPRGFFCSRFSIKNEGGSFFVCLPFLCLCGVPSPFFPHSFSHLISAQLAAQTSRDFSDRTEQETKQQNKTDTHRTDDCKLRNHRMKAGMNLQSGCSLFFLGTFLLSALIFFFLLCIQPIFNFPQSCPLSVPSSHFFFHGHVICFFFLPRLFLNLVFLRTFRTWMACLPKFNLHTDRQHLLLFFSFLYLDQFAVHATVSRHCQPRTFFSAPVSPSLPVAIPPSPAQGLLSSNPQEHQPKTNN